MSQALCKTVSCYGQTICHEVEIGCNNGTALCTMKVPQCSDKSIEDYEKELIDSRSIELLVQKPDYMNSNDKDVLCQGINCYGMNTCTIVRVPCIDDPTCINYLPFCDDSPIPSTTLTILSIGS
ncbi:hypothetical protein CAEBREN_09058 [Caenorhabditis brenneri]|uniref:Uncharacterized protein n=1 Tax=Caenorhabditis brenneri TaxID=135651 RepID=G0NU17_CAEBE|nr:hypothetical protein CAEBREN_09058 [Caenorhabditis brenneri]